MALKLSKRLKTIVDLCDPCECIVDVGTDHGYVPISLANDKIAKVVVASDIKEDPINICKKNIELYLDNDSSEIKTVVSDGLKGIDKNISLGIIISGMGFDAIKDILSNIEEYNYKFLIISPHTKVNEFMKFASMKNLMIDIIKTVYEDDKAYFIFKCYNKKIWDRLYGDVNEN